MKKVTSLNDLKIGDWILVVFYNSNESKFPFFALFYGQVLRIVDEYINYSVHSEIHLNSHTIKGVPVKHDGFSFTYNRQGVKTVPLNCGDIYTQVHLSNQLIEQIIQEKINGYMTVHAEERWYDYDNPLYQYWQNISGNKYRLVAKDCSNGEELGSIKEFKYPNLQQINIYDKRFN